MCEYKEDMDTAFRLNELFRMNCFRNWEKLLSHYCILVFVIFFDVRSSREGVVMLIFVFLIFLNSSRLFHRWSYGILLYEIFTIGELFWLFWGIRFWPPVS